MSSSPVVPSKQATSYATGNSTDNAFGSTEEANQIWLVFFDELRNFMEDHGYSNVLPRCGGTQLSVWVDEQRS
eukprot:CAMPEP_0116024320 /NCGR_PEP_ID=MMETSP0321-20121206/12237_1 /TAXON_ID=163516 /ORGANISM="Leptocylindrus danicus var. danicus, Strain B650" /LENGTH=72 /DNA_ID=CAMNT_0003496009 /DNA_START=155 /DNA_END=370 /DNA_ORIENTATION=+